MSNFTQFSHILLTESNLFKLGENLIYERGFKGSGVYIIVPSGFETDFASIPIILQVFVKPNDPRWVKSTIIHDFLWSDSDTLREYQDANDIFYEAMLVEGTPKYLAIFAYLSVSVSKYIYWIVNKLKKYLLFYKKT